MNVNNRNGFSVLAVIIALAVAACGNESAGGPRGGATLTPSTRTTSSPPVSDGPSQSVADAARDGVIPELAALPMRVRVDVQRSVVTPEGVWVLSRPTAQAKPAKGCRLGPDTGKYPTSTICTTEYGELLLLDSSRTHILRAYPMPSVPPTFLVVTRDAVWCGRSGDTKLSETTLPDSMVCRVDRRTFAAHVRGFAPGEESEVMQPCFFPPHDWTVGRGRLQMTALAADSRGLWARAANGTWTQLNPRTLAVVARGVTR